MSTHARRRNKSSRRPVASVAAAVSAPAEPERLLLDAIADGELDHSLHAVADAAQARLRLLHTVESATALARLTVGDEVRFNHTVKPQYLRGAHGRITDLDHHTASVCLGQRSAASPADRSAARHSPSSACRAPHRRTASKSPTAVVVF